VLSVGMIPFLGLIIPNIVTIYQGDHLQKSLIHTALLGAVFVLASDVIGRIIIYPYEIPISLTVGVFGTGIFIYLLLRRKKDGLYKENIISWYYCIRTIFFIYIL